MISVIGVLTGVSPGDVHLTRRNVNDHGGDRVLAVQRIDAFDVMVADRIRQIDVILLDGLHGFDIV